MKTQFESTGTVQLAFSLSQSDPNLVAHFLGPSSGKAAAIRYRQTAPHASHEVASSLLFLKRLGAGADYSRYVSGIPSKFV
ncbi:MAG: hypothetical protein AAFU64_07230, partial [Bacteroidota bacterium]